MCVRAFYVNLTATLSQETTPLQPYISVHIKIAFHFDHFQMHGDARASLSVSIFTITCLYFNFWQDRSQASDGTLIDRLFVTENGSKGCGGKTTPNGLAQNNPVRQSSCHHLILSLSSPSLVLPCLPQLVCLYHKQL